MDMQILKQIAYGQLGSRRSHTFKERGNKYYHGLRVATLAVKLRKHILPEDAARDNILTAAAWFHDICNGEEDHAVKGSLKTRELLTPHCTGEELEQICAIIAVHDDRSEARAAYSPYVKLHQDADHLDHFGTFDIWTHFIEAIPEDKTIEDVRSYLVNTRPLKNERYRDELNFAVSKQIFDEKMTFLNAFTQRFNIEASGGIWQEELFEK